MARRRPSRSQARFSPKPPEKAAKDKAAIPARSASTPRPVRRRMLAVSMAAIATLLITVALVARFTAISPTRLRVQAEAATQAADWPAAAKAWHAYNSTSSASADSFKQEARACLTLGLAAQAERNLRLAIAADPNDAEAWRLTLEILRVEDRPLDAQSLGWQAYDSVPLSDRPALLKQLTLALLTDVPDDIARTTLNRWITADPNDLDARVALSARIAAQPRASDPDRDTRLAELQSILQRRPDHTAAREALVTALFDAGEPEQAHTLLNSWPDSSRDARYWRLQGRYLLDHARQPDLAAQALRNAIASLPQDWRSWYRLARALRASKQPDGADLLAAQTVARIRETLDPITLVPRLDAAFAHLDQSTALTDLAALCDHLGLSRLAAAWRAQIAPNPGATPSPTTPKSALKRHSQLSDNTVHSRVARSPRPVAEPKQPLSLRLSSRSRSHFGAGNACVGISLGSISGRVRQPINRDRTLAIPRTSGKPQGCRSIQPTVRRLEQNHDNFDQLSVRITHPHSFG